MNAPVNSIVNHLCTPEIAMFVFRHQELMLKKIKIPLHTIYSCYEPYDFEIAEQELRWDRYANLTENALLFPDSVKAIYNSLGSFVFGASIFQSPVHPGKKPAEYLAFKKNLKEINEGAMAYNNRPDIKFWPFAGEAISEKERCFLEISTVDYYIIGLGIARITEQRSEVVDEVFFMTLDGDFHATNLTMIQMLMQCPPPGTPEWIDLGLPNQDCELITHIKGSY
jgi:hypothetical protein